MLRFRSTVLIHVIRVNLLLGLLLLSHHVRLVARFHARHHRIGRWHAH